MSHFNRIETFSYLFFILFFFFVTFPNHFVRNMHLVNREWHVLLRYVTTKEEYRKSWKWKKKLNTYIVPVLRCEVCSAVEWYSAPFCCWRFVIASGGEPRVWYVMCLHYHNNVYMQQINKIIIFGSSLLIPQFPIQSLTTHRTRDENKNVCVPSQ